MDELPDLIHHRLGLEEVIWHYGLEDLCMRLPPGGRTDFWYVKQTHFFLSILSIPHTPHYSGSDRLLSIITLLTIFVFLMLLP